MYQNKTLNKNDENISIHTCMQESGEAVRVWLPNILTMVYD